MSDPLADQEHDILRNQRKQVFRADVMADMEKLALFDRLVDTLEVCADTYETLGGLETERGIRQLVAEARSIGK